MSKAQPGNKIQAQNQMNQHTNETNQNQNQIHQMCTEKAWAGGLWPPAHPLWVYTGCICFMF